MREITREESLTLRKNIGDGLELYSSFTHVKGVSNLTSFWTHIETTYSYGAIFFTIKTTQDTSYSEEITKFYISLNDDYVDDLLY